MTDLNSEMYAVVVARVARRGHGRLAEILSELGITAEDFQRGEPTVLSELASAWPRRMGKSAMKFSTALAEELCRLGALASGTDAPPPEPVVALVAEKSVPSFLHPSPLPAAPFAAPLPIVALVEVPEPPPRVHRPPARLAGTAEADLSAIVAAVQRGPLPFAASATPSPASVPEAAKPPPAPPPPGSPSTVALPAMGDEIDLAQYPLELYASLTGALARGETREQVLAAHHLTPALFEKLARAWGARFRSDPQLLERFQTLARSSASQGARQG
jgi:hypothetical protein